MNLLAVSELPAEAPIRCHLARWGLQENQLEHGVERWGINHLEGRRVDEYPPDALVPNPARRRLDRVLKLLHTPRSLLGSSSSRLTKASIAPNSTPRPAPS